MRRKNIAWTVFIRIWNLVLSCSGGSDVTSTTDYYEFHEFTDWSHRPNDLGNTFIGTFKGSSGSKYVAFKGFATDLPGGKDAQIEGSLQEFEAFGRINGYPPQNVFIPVNNKPCKMGVAKFVMKKKDYGSDKNKDISVEGTITCELGILETGEREDEVKKVRREGKDSKNETASRTAGVMKTRNIGIFNNKFMGQIKVFYGDLTVLSEKAKETKGTTSKKTKYNIYIQGTLRFTHIEGPTRIFKIAKCGRANQELALSGRRIIGGKMTKPFTFPWQILIINKKLENEENEAKSAIKKREVTGNEDIGKSGRKEILKDKDGLKFCIGTLVSSQAVLTTVTCVRSIISDNFDAYSATGSMIGVGSNFKIGKWIEGYEKFAEMLQIKYIRHHPDFEEILCPKTGYTVYKANFAIIMVKPLDLNYFHSPICLPEKLQQSKQDGVNITGQPLIAAGWGKTEKNEYSVNTKWVKIEEKASTCPKDACPQPGDLCSNTKSASCGEGDMGGGLMYVIREKSENPTLNNETGPLRYYVVGVASYGVGKCGEKDYYSVYSRFKEDDEVGKWITKNS